MVKILLADDDPHVRSIIREYAQAEDWQFIEASCLTFSTLLFYIGATRYDPHH